MADQQLVNAITALTEEVRTLRNNVGELVTVLNITRDDPLVRSLDSLASAVSDLHFPQGGPGA